jgi:molybdenum cofactor guanylyltransferase
VTKCAPAAAILIGGRARRLEGRVKSALDVGGRSILARQLAALRSAGIEEIVLIGRTGQTPEVDVPVFADATDNAGALAGLYTALLVTTSDRTVVVAGDMPFVTDRLFRAIAGLGIEDDAVMPRTEEGRHPLCACYRRKVAPRLKAHLDVGQLTVRDAVAGLRVRELASSELEALDPGGTMLMNVNTLADYDLACRVAGQSKRGREHRV